MEDIKIQHLEVVVMPNGEVICLGKTIGFTKNLERYLSDPESKMVDSIFKKHT